VKSAGDVTAMKAYDDHELVVAQNGATGTRGQQVLLNVTQVHQHQPQSYNETQVHQLIRAEMVSLRFWIQEQLAGHLRKTEDLVLQLSAAGEKHVLESLEMHNTSMFTPVERREKSLPISVKSCNTSEYGTEKSSLRGALQAEPAKERAVPTPLTEDVDRMTSVPSAGTVGKSDSLHGQKPKVVKMLQKKGKKAKTGVKNLVVKSQPLTPQSRRGEAPDEKHEFVRPRSQDWEERMHERVTHVLEDTGKFLVEPPDTLLYRFTEGHCFSFLVALAIATNAIIMGVDAQFAMDRALHDPLSNRPSFFIASDIVFTVFFCVELMLRILAQRLSFLCGEEWSWNIFDATLVFISILEASTSTNMNQTSSTGYIRLLKIIRMVRVLRIIRIMRFFRELRRMCMSIISSMAAFSWALVLLVLIEYVFAILFLQAGVDRLTSGEAIKYQWHWEHYFGSVPLAFFTLTKAISGGEDWGPMTENLEEASWLYLMAFVFYVLFVVFGVLNVLTGVFLDSAAEILTQDRDWLTQDESIRQEMFMKNFLALFKELDLSHHGRLDWGDFMDAMDHASTQAFFTANGLDVHDAHTLFALMAGKDHTIDVGHFIKGCSRLRGPARHVHVMRLLKDTDHLRAEVKRAVRDREMEKSSTKSHCIPHAEQSSSLIGAETHRVWHDLV